MLFLNNNAFCLDTHTIRKEEVNVAWDAGDNIVEWHEIRYVFTDVSPEVMDSTVITIPMPVLEATIPRLRSGHFALLIRACKSDVIEPLCSRYVRSDIEGVPEPWNIYWKPNIPFHIFVIEDF